MTAAATLVPALAPGAALPPWRATAATVVAAEPPGPSVAGDDDGDQYLGTGGLILPASVGHDTRGEVAACPGCAWRLSTPCLAPGLGNPFDGQSTCLSVVRGCRGGHLLRAWFQPAGGRWRDLGLVCIPESGPVTVAEVERAVQDGFVRGVPPLEPKSQPTVGILAQIPVVFDSGQPGGVREWEVNLLGRTVSLTARPGWDWTFGDGADLQTSDPGGRYPHAGVAHAYRREGDYLVTCTTTWTGTFLVDGLGPFPVVEPIRQRERVWVRVGEGRALLAPPPSPLALPRG